MGRGGVRFGVIWEWGGWLEGVGAAGHFFWFDGVVDNLEERKQLPREQNGFLQRITICLERTRVVGAVELDMDSTMRE